MGERARDEDALEALRELLEDRSGCARQQAVDLVRQPVLPVERECRRARLAQFGRQVGDLDGLPGRHHRQPVAEVFELAHVAGEVEPAQVAQGRFGQALAIDAEFLRALLQEVLAEQRDVLGPFAQARQADADDVEAMEEVLAEQSLAHARLEVLVRRGDDAHVRFQGRVPADAVVVAVGEDAQQAGLQLGRHVADLVEEQRAALGLLEASAALGSSAGEGAALVAEEFGFEQVLRDRRGVDGDEGTGGARTVAVQRARDEFLAGARLAGDQHGRVRLREAADRAKQLLHRRRLAEDFRGQGDRLGAAPLARTFIERAPDQFERLIDVEGLGQVFEGTALEGGDRAVEVGIRGHDDHRQRREAFLDPLQQVESGAAGHADVGDEHLRRLAPAVEGSQRLVGRGKTAKGDALARERLFQYPANRVVVVDDPDRLH